MKRVYQTDWLASRPVFYNEKTCQVSHNINDVIDYGNLEFDPDGFNDFLDFGYSVLEQTPVKHVKFLRHSSKLTVTDDGQLIIERFPDPVDTWLDRRLSEDDVFELIRARIHNWEMQQEGEIIIPTSGGYDSRLLSTMIHDRSRIRAFTYGISEDQIASSEVVFARELSRKLHTKWEQIFLGHYHEYFDYWDRLYGVSTHAHGMYHVEFYRQIRQKVSGNALLLSGIIGDAWSGNFVAKVIKNPDDLTTLGYRHGLHSDSVMSHLPSQGEARENYFNKQSDRLCDPRLYIIESMRFKIILLSYLLTIPLAFGFRPWSPFLDIEVATAMLNLPPERRQNRLWQKEFFARHGLDFEAQQLTCSYQNNLDYQAMRNIPPSPLPVCLLSSLVRSDYIEWINHHVSHQGDFWDTLYRLLQVPKVGGVLRCLRVRDERLQAYYAYLTLKPIASLLERAQRIYG